MSDFSYRPPESSGFPQLKRNRPRRSGMFWGVLALTAGALALLFFTPYGQRAGRGISRRLFPEERVAKTPPKEPAERILVQGKVIEKRVEVPVVASPPALPSGPPPGPRGDFTTMFSGIGVKTKLIATDGDTATVERASPDAYTAEVTVRIHLPKAAGTMDQMRSLNPQIGNVLPDLERMMRTGKVSGLYRHLYNLKKEALEDNLERLDRALSRHNFFDLDTVLELEHPDSKRKVLLLQGDMDVVSDGSDGDRMPVFDDAILKSAFFQPSTSYGWAKTTTNVNPVIPKLEAEMAESREKLKTAKLPKGEKDTLTARVAQLPGVIADLQKRSYLIGQEDPFVVIPMSFRTYKGNKAWLPQIGDYAVILYGDRLLPAVIGDYGPSVKVGEASLRIAREIDASASPYKRPVNDLQVSYLFFPDTADTVRKAPDYAAWRTRCEALLKEIGGYGTASRLHTWEDRLTPPPAVAVPVTSPPAADEAAAASSASAAPANPPGTGDSGLNQRPSAGSAAGNDAR
ncbi:MAG: glycoside hydrolase family 75 protein [Verrucomicrobiota bacterium]